MITVITPTCDRPFGIRLAEKYMARQTVKPDQWIVADGGQRRAELTMGQCHIHRASPPGPKNLAGNMQIALSEAARDFIIVMEDDDWYDPRHIEACIAGLDRADAYGCSTLLYYHVGWRQYRRMANRGAALCQTAFRAAIKGRMESAIAQAVAAGDYGIDGRFWQGMEEKASGAQTVIGIKGLPGTKGLGVGHRESRMWQDDANLSILKGWIGDDWREYAQCASSS